MERFPGLEAAGCSSDNPCSIVWVWHFHYISIPLMAASAFALIAALLLLVPAAGGASDHAGRSRLARVTALNR